MLENVDLKSVFSLCVILMCLTCAWMRSFSGFSYYFTVLGVLCLSCVYLSLYGFISIWGFCSFWMLFCVGSFLCSYLFVLLGFWGVSFKCRNFHYKSDSLLTPVFTRFHNLAVCKRNISLYKFVELSKCV